MPPFKLPKDNEKYRWTSHVVRKMMHYRLTPARVLRIVRAPERTEKGVASGTLAGMHRAGSKAKPAEIWAMWRTEGRAPGSKMSEVGMSKSESENSPFAIHTSPLSRERLVIITAWRYPGVSPVRDAVPIPSDILAELDSEGLLDG